MAPGSDSVWCWSGNAPYVLSPGDDVFVSIGKHLPLTLVGLALTLLESFNLRSHVYHGLQKAPAGLTSNIHIPALREFRQSRALFVALSPTLSFSESNDWILDRMDEAIRRGVSGAIYLVRENLKATETEPSPSSLPTLLPTRLIEDIGEFENSLRKDVLSLMGQS